MTSHANQVNPNVDGHSINRVNAQLLVSKNVPRILNHKKQNNESRSKTY